MLKFTKSLFSNSKHTVRFDADGAQKEIVLRRTKGGAKIGVPFTVVAEPPPSQPAAKIPAECAWASLPWVLLGASPPMTRWCPRHTRDE